MTTHTIRLHNIAQVKDFVNQCSGCSFEITLSSGQAVINAKSIMGLFSLDLSQPVQVEVHGTDAQRGAFQADVAAFRVDAGQ